MRLKSFKLNFIRPLQTVPSFYLKFLYGDKTHKEDFSFEESNSIFYYNYPIQLFFKNETELNIELQLKENFKKDYRNPNTSFESESVYSNNISVKSMKKSSPNKQKNLIELASVDKLYTILDLNYKKDGVFQKKLPINMSIKGTDREVGTLEMDI